MNLNEQFNNIIARNAPLNDVEILELEIGRFLSSDKRRSMVDGDNYYRGNQAVLGKKRQVIGEHGTLTTVENLPNNIILDNRYSYLVDQKVNYLLTKPIEVRADDEKQQTLLDSIFTKAFHRRLKNVGIDAINGGIAFLHPYVLNGELRFKRFKPQEVMPIWADDEHEVLQAFARVYSIIEYEQKRPQTHVKVEYYTTSGISYYEYKDGKLIAEREPVSYLEIDGKPYNWQKVPLIAFKYNDTELPLIKRIKCLQDALNTLISKFADNISEDAHSTILVLRNYEGEDLSTFRYNLATYGVVKVGTSIDGSVGDLDTLRIEVNSSNFELIINLLRKAIIENGRGFDAKDDRMANNPNQMNIRSMYADIDLDANNMELEFQASLEELLWYVNTFNGITGKNAVEGVEFIFNRDVLINESETINNCRNSVGILSTETIIANHPWTIDTADELERLKQEQMEQMAEYIAVQGANESGDE